MGAICGRRKEFRCNICHADPAIAIFQQGVIMNPNLWGSAFHDVFRYDRDQTERCGDASMRIKQIEWEPADRIPYVTAMPGNQGICLR
ncbi:hypothetical protein BBO01nite_43270 [Brevibacillus borstelensis]|jgi:hypothetical protein|nr:hypothetical protein BBO01nite_43270 [Brevibacillus borstelensis]